VNNALIEKIRKILSRTEQAGCTPAEAETAYAMAARLLAEHNLSMADVELTSPETETFDHQTEREDIGRHYRQEHDLAQSAACYATFTRSLIFSTRHQGKAVAFFGTRENAEAAQWMFRAMLESYRRLFAEYRSTTGAPASDKRAFLVGVTSGFMARIREERETLQAEQDILRGTPSGSTALVLASVKDKTEIAFNRKYAKIKPVRQASASAPIDSVGALEAGKQAGRSLRLSRPLPSPRETQAELCLA
jgi:hypothetical protein